MLLCTGFQGLENGAYLGSKGVLWGWSEKEIGRWYKWSARCWMGHVGMEFVRLGRELVLRRRRVAEKAVVEGQGVAEQETDVAIAGTKEVQKWWRDIYVNSAWMPITVHYSLGPGFLGSGSVAALGLVPALTALREAWRASA